MLLYMPASWAYSTDISPKLISAMYVKKRNSIQFGLTKNFHIPYHVSAFLSIFNRCYYIKSFKDITGRHKELIKVSGILIILCCRFYILISVACNKKSKF